MTYDYTLLLQEKRKMMQAASKWIQAGGLVVPLRGLVASPTWKNNLHEQNKNERNKKDNSDPESATKEITKKERNAGKIPVYRKDENGQVICSSFKQATSDLDLFCSLFEYGNGVGLALNYLQPFLVIDIDNGEDHTYCNEALNSLTRLSKEHSNWSRCTYTQKSLSGGSHYFFKIPLSWKKKLSQGYRFKINAFEQAFKGVQILGLNAPESASGINLAPTKTAFGVTEIISNVRPCEMPVDVMEKIEMFFQKKPIINYKLSQNNYDQNDNEAFTEYCVEAALSSISSRDYFDWINVGRYLSNYSNGERLWHHWSMTNGGNYDLKTAQQKWHTFHHNSSQLGLGSLFHLAKENGFNYKATAAEYARIHHHISTTNSSQNVHDDVSKIMNSLDDPIDILDTLECDSVTLGENPLALDLSLSIKKENVYEIPQKTNRHFAKRP